MKPFVIMILCVLIAVVFPIAIGVSLRKEVERRKRKEIQRLEESEKTQSGRMTLARDAEARSEKFKKILPIISTIAIGSVRLLVIAGIAAIPAIMHDLRAGKSIASLFREEPALCLSGAIGVVYPIVFMCKYLGGKRGNKG